VTSVKGLAQHCGPVVFSFKSIRKLPEKLPKKSSEENFFRGKTGKYFGVKEKTVGSMA
jgi:hypothetical protein